MAVNKPYGDNARVGAVKDGPKFIILKLTNGLSGIHKQENLWM